MLSHKVFYDLYVQAEQDDICLDADVGVHELILQYVMQTLHV